MIEHYFLIFWAIWLFLLLIGAFRVMGFGPARRRQDRKWKNRTRNQQSAALIIPVKGFDLQSTPRFFDTMFSQDYREYRVIVTFESWQDPVAIWLTEQLDLNEDNPVWIHPENDTGLGSVTLVCSGTSKNEGQKVHNQIAAFHELNDNDAVIAFADADIVCDDQWLASLLAPINLGTHPLSTTYRWLIPKRPTLPNHFASVINGSITTQGGSDLTNVLWGGSMALSRKTFDDLDVPSLLVGSLNDDLRLSKAARKAGNKIAFVRSLVIPTQIDFNWHSFFEFAKRQYTQVKFFSPILYTGANIVLGFYVLGALSLIGALFYGYFFAWIPIAGAYVIDQFRGLARQQVYLSLFPENEIRRKLFAACWLEHMLTPVWMLLHWFIIFTTWSQNEVTWAGIRYRILSKSKTRILDRPESVETLPASSPGLALIAALHDKRRGTYTRPIQPVAAPKPETVTTKVETPAPFKIGLGLGTGPTSIGPFSHPGVSPYVTSLASAPRVWDLLPLYQTLRFPDATRQNPLLTQQQIPQFALARLTRYSPLAAIIDFTEQAKPKDNIGASTIRPLKETSVSSKVRTPRSESFPNCSRAKDSFAPNRALNNTISGAGRRLSKSRLLPINRYPTNPKIASSSAPRGVFPPDPNPAANKPGQVSAYYNSTLLSRSVAAHRADGTKRDRHMGVIAPKTVRSGRANHVGSAGRGTGQTRPVNRRASGRTT